MEGREMTPMEKYQQSLSWFDKPRTYYDPGKKTIIFVDDKPVKRGRPAKNQ
jgi:hypothetical protein